MKGRSAAAGFSLIEVMIAVLILGVGLLGFAMLQTTSLRMAQSAGYRTQATNLATELLDQMRANRLSAAAYANAATFNGGDSTQPCVPGIGAQTVANITNLWKCQVVRALGDGARANVVYNGNLVTVTMIWGERVRTDAANQSTTSFTVTTRL